MANVIVNDSYLKAIATAIRSKKNTTSSYKVSNFASQINSIPTGYTYTTSGDSPSLFYLVNGVRYDITDTSIKSFDLNSATLKSSPESSISSLSQNGGSSYCVNKDTDGYFDTFAIRFYIDDAYEYGDTSIYLLKNFDLYVTYYDGTKTHNTPDGYANRYALNFCANPISSTYNGKFILRNSANIFSRTIVTYNGGYQIYGGKYYPAITFILKCDFPIFTTVNFIFYDTTKSIYRYTQFYK